jgi:hypothetical protein
MFMGNGENAEKKSCLSTEEVSILMNCFTLKGIKSGKALKILILYHRFEPILLP